jgi:hypothetical protein
MLDSNEINNPEAIEKYFCVEFEKLRQMPMDEETTSILAKLLFSKPLDIKDIPEKDKPFLIKMMEKRIRVLYTYQMNDAKALLFLAFISKTPGIAVMYLTFLQYKAFKMHKKEIDLNDICEIFFNGFPGESDLSMVWHKQKIHKKPNMHSDNLLDYPYAAKSIQFQLQE